MPQFKQRLGPHSRLFSQRSVVAVRGLELEGLRKRRLVARLPTHLPVSLRRNERISFKRRKPWANSALRAPGSERAQRAFSASSALLGWGSSFKRRALWATSRAKSARDSLHRPASLRA